MSLYAFSRLPQASQDRLVASLAQTVAEARSAGRPYLVEYFWLRSMLRVMRNS